jgi:hypothetical protein
METGIVDRVWFSPHDAYNIHLSCKAVPNGYSQAVILKCGASGAEMRIKGVLAGGGDILKMLFYDGAHIDIYGDPMNCIKADFRPLGA